MFLVVERFPPGWSGGGGGPNVIVGCVPPLNGRSSHLIEAAKRGRLDQMIFFSAPLTTRAPPGRPAGRPAERPAERPPCRHVVASSVPISSPKLKTPIHLNYNPPFWPWWLLHCWANSESIPRNLSLWKKKLNYFLVYDWKWNCNWHWSWNDLRECQKLWGGLCILYCSYKGGLRPP